MALTKAQVSLVTVATLGAAPGGFTADLLNFGSQVEVAALALSVSPTQAAQTNAEFALQVAKNLGVSAGDKAVTEFFNKLEAGASRAEAAVDFANAQLVAQGGNIASVKAATESTSTSTDLNELTKVVSSTDSALTVKFEDKEADQTVQKFTSQTIGNVGKAQIDAGESKISADFTFALKNQIGEADTFKGFFLSPILDRQAASSTGSQLFLELLDLRAQKDDKAALERVPVDTFAFGLNGSQILVQSEAIYAAKTYQELFDAIKARVEELGQGVNVPTTNSDGTAADAAAYAKLAGFTVELGSNFTVKNQNGDDVSGTQIILKDSGGATLVPQGFVNKAGVIPDPGYTLYAQLNDVEPTTVTKLITTNLDADNVGYGSQGASVNLAGQSASNKGVEEIKVLATKGVWFTKLESKAATNHLQRVELKSGSEGYFRVGTQENSPNHVVSLVDQDFSKGGLVDVQQVEASAAGETAINSYISENVLGRYDFKDTGIYTADDSKAAITYNLSSGQDILNLAIDTKVLAAVDTQVNVNTGAGDDVITVMATNGLGLITNNATAAISGTGWLINQQLNDNIKIDAGAGNDWILTPGAGNATILAGAGNDVVRVDNTGDRGVFVFNNATTDINKLKLNQDLDSNSDNGLSAGANGSAQTFDFYKAVVKVTFKGFESAFVTIDSTNYQTTTKQINQAIKKAVNTDPVLNKLIAAMDNEGNALAIESLIDGLLTIGELDISIIPPVTYNATETAAAKTAREEAGQLMLNNGEEAKADTALNLVAGTTTAAGSMTTNATAAETLYDTELATSGGTPGSTVASVTGVEGTAGVTAVTEVLEVQTFDLSSLPAVNALGDSITITLDGQAFTYVTLANNETASTIADGLGVLVAAGGYATSSTGNIVTVSQIATNGAPIAQGTVTGTGAFATPGITGATTTDGITAVTEVLEAQTLDLSAVTVAAGESMIFTIDGTDYTYTNGTAGALTGEPLVDALVSGLTVTGYAVTKPSTTDLAITQSAGNGSDIADITTAIGTAGTAGAAIAGTNSGAESDNVIDLGTGQDVLVLGTGAESNDTVVFKGYNLGEKTIVNFTTAAVTSTQGVDLLDFTSYLNSVDGNKAVIANTVAGDFSTTNGVTLVNFTGANTVDNTAGTVAYLTFAELTEANVKALLNNANAAGEINSVSGLSATAANNNVLMVQGTGDDANVYKAFHVTTGATSATADVKLIGTFDFGDADISGLATTDLV